MSRRTARGSTSSARSERVDFDFDYARCMPKLVVHGALLQCSMGMSPSSLSVLPTNKLEGAQQNAATVQDYTPMVNISPFGMCQSPANPQVAAATAAAMGVLTPQPCIPNTTSPWTPGSTTVQIANVA